MQDCEIMIQRSWHVVSDLPRNMKRAEALVRAGLTPVGDNPNNPEHWALPPRRRIPLLATERGWSESSKGVWEQRREARSRSPKGVSSDLAEQSDDERHSQDLLLMSNGQPAQKVYNIGDSWWEQPLTPPWKEEGTDSPPHLWRQEQQSSQEPSSETNSEEAARPWKSH